MITDEYRLTLTHYKNENGLVTEVEPRKEFVMRSCCDECKNEILKELFKGLYQYVSKDEVKLESLVDTIIKVKEDTTKFFADSASTEMVSHFFADRLAYELNLTSEMDRVIGARLAKNIAKKEGYNDDE